MRYNPNVQTVLSLETSCDESAAAILRLEGGKLQLLASFIASQADTHAQWGGVVPEMASRMHLEALPCLIRDSLLEADLDMNGIDLIASTVAPGLNGALMVGSITARTLSLLHRVPFLGIHHLEGHLASVFLSDNSPTFPYLVLLVSGGHTELIYVSGIGKYKLMGRSHDDAAGEAFDKVARLLDLGYPGGPEIQKCALNGNPFKFSLPKGRVSRPEGGFYPYDFSFSGLKTAMLRLVQSLEKKEAELPVPDLAASFEQIVAEVLVERSLKCAHDLGVNTLVMVGGVASNLRLRDLMQTRAYESSISLHLAPQPFCTDNAAMIGAAALFRLECGVTASPIDLGVSARLPLEKADCLYQKQAPF